METMKQSFCWEGVKDTKKVHLNLEVKDFKIDPFGGHIFYGVDIEE